MRIKDHPIFGAITYENPIRIYLGDQAIEAYEGDTIAAALWAAGQQVSRYTPKRCDPRGLFCAIGHCSDCLMTVDGVPNVRTCVTLAKDGMKVEIQQGHGDWSNSYE